MAAPGTEGLERALVKLELQMNGYVMGLRHTANELRTAQRHAFANYLHPQFEQVHQMLDKIWDRKDQDVFEMLNLQQLYHRYHLTILRALKTDFEFDWTYAGIHFSG